MKVKGGLRELDFSGNNLFLINDESASHMLILSINDTIKLRSIIDEIKDSGEELEDTNIEVDFTPKIDCKAYVVDQVKSLKINGEDVHF